jgi:hypothetical protein
MPVVLLPLLLLHALASCLRATHESESQICNTPAFLLLMNQRRVGEKHSDACGRSWMARKRLRKISCLKGCGIGWLLVVNRNQSTQSVWTVHAGSVAVVFQRCLGLGDTSAITGG